MSKDNLIGSIILEGGATAEDTVLVDGGRGKHPVAEGTLQDMDVENRNHRIYAKEDLEPEIHGARMKELLKAHELVGECGHPLAEDLIRQQTIDPKLACVRFNDIWIDGNLVKGRFQGTNNEYGKTFDEDLREGVKPAFSLRALGAIENVNGKAYVRGIRIITYDRVVYPSHKAAYTEKLLSESAVSSNMNINSVKESMLYTDPMNDTGKIINLTGADAQYVLNRLQRESANITSVLETFEGLSDHICLENNRLKMTTRFGETLYLDLENHVDNLIMDYVWGL